MWDRAAGTALRLAHKVRSFQRQGAIDGSELASQAGQALQARGYPCAVDVDRAGLRV